MAYYNLMMINENIIHIARPQLRVPLLFHSTFDMNKIFCCFRGREEENTSVQKLAKKAGNDISTFPLLQSDAVASLVLDVVEKQMSMDDPALLIDWDEAGFNDVPASPGCRHGGAQQTKAAIIANIQAAGGVNVLGLNNMFLFKTNQDLTNWEIALPAWVRHQAGVPDVCISVCRITRLTISGNIDVDLYPYPFNR